MSRNMVWRATPAQEQLLKAALFRGETAIQAWESWQENADLKSLDKGSARLLPLLYKNLSPQGIKHPLMTEFKQLYDRTWMKNQYAVYQLANLLTAFQDAGIEALLLKGMALTLFYYQDFGVRSMNDYDLVVKANQVPEALRVLNELGWEAEDENPLQKMSVVHASSFRNAKGQHLDLHWHIMHECCTSSANDVFWKNAIRKEIRGVPVWILSPAHQLLHVCVHGAKWDAIPPIRWVADAMVVLKLAGDSINWEGLLQFAKEYRLVYPLKKTFKYLSQTCSAPIPANILEQLSEMPVSNAEKFEFYYRNENYHHKLLGYLPVMWFDHLRRSSGENAAAKSLGFLKYLRNYWGLSSIWQMPLKGIEMSRRRIRKLYSPGTDYS